MALDKIESEHCYSLKYLTDDQQEKTKDLVITNLLPSDDRNQMLKDLSFLAGVNVVDYLYKNDSN